MRLILFVALTGKAQKTFFHAARRGWTDLKLNTIRHLTRGVTEYEYVQTLSDLLDSQAARLLEDWVDAWDYQIYDNPRFNRAIRCEAERDISRWYCDDYAV